MKNICFSIYDPFIIFHNVLLPLNALPRMTFSLFRPFVCKIDFKIIFYISVCQIHTTFKISSICNNMIYDYNESYAHRQYHGGSPVIQRVLRNKYQLLFGWLFGTVYSVEGVVNRVSNHDISFSPTCIRT